MSQNTASKLLTGIAPAIEAGTRLLAFVCQGMARLESTKRRALIALVVRVVGAALAYVMQILFAQWLGLTEYGVFVGVWVWLLVLSGAAPLGFNISVIGMLPAYKDSADFDRWRGTLLTSVGVTVISSVALSVVGWVALYSMPDLVSSQYFIPVWLCLFCLPLMALGDTNEGIARAHGWMTTALLPVYVIRPTCLIAGMSAALLVGVRPDAAYAMATAIMACLVTVFAQAAVLIFRLRKIEGWGKVRARPKTWLLASLPIVVAHTFELVMQNFDMLAISYFLGPEETGIYFAALKTIALLAFVTFAVGAATANQVASLHAGNDREGLGDAIGGAINLAFWPTLLGALAIVVLAPFLLSLFGDDFVAHSYLTAVLAIGFLAKSFVGPAELYLNVMGQQRVCALVLILAAVLNMLLNIALIPLLGLLGAAIATTAALIALSIGLFVITRQRIGVTLCPTIPVTSFRKVSHLLMSAK